jgi:hypothetical protein
MPNGRIGDHPLTDMFSYGRHPFPADMEAMLRKLDSVRPGILSELGLEPFDWEAGRNLDAGRERLRDLLRQHGIDPQSLCSEG